MFVLFSVPAEKLTNDHFDGEAAIGRSANLSAGWAMPPRIPTAFVLRTNTYARSVPRSIPSAALPVPKGKYF